MIKNVIFDLGNVLVGVDFDKTRSLILAEGISKKKYSDFFGKSLRSRFEEGRVNTREFMDMAYNSFGNKITKIKLKALFEDMFYEIPEMKNFLKKLRRSHKYELFLLSNTNPLHFNYIKKKFAYVNYIDKFILSYKVKMAKPDSKIYKAVLKKFKLNPYETLFIDDLNDNCTAAGKFGIKTICYKNYRTFEKQFRKITST